ncbi:MAG: hypothetical protein AB7I79_23305 [Rhizobiaceae bacterium]
MSGSLAARDSARRDRLKWSERVIVMAGLRPPVVVAISKLFQDYPTAPQQAANGLYVWIGLSLFLHRRVSQRV